MASLALVLPAALAATQLLLTTCSPANLLPEAVAAVSLSDKLLTTFKVTRCVVRLLRVGEYLQRMEQSRVGSCSLVSKLTSGCIGALAKLPAFFVGD